ncbi:MAG: UDP-N-acetylmuramoyl-tripeptide--D-alanyl-D-alanine ligase [Tannerellaceae bacterium]|nr:UDP-N-acetylmuramoyl-tripeptide--D-alanyl-D-alanine ligase [Tannerellaceae bacterium]
MDISDLYQLFLRHPQVSTDSRRCPAGSMFFALRGKNFDANRFAGQALEAGAEYAVVDRAEYCRGERTILVDDTLKALQGLAQLHRQTLGIPVIGITGTNGKTTTKELLAAVLSSRFNVLYTEGNLNNQIGVPLTLLRLRRDHEMAVIEMGASRPGDIAELVDIAQPNFGLITNVGQAHLEGFGSLQGVTRTKGELYDYLRRTKGVVFINKENIILHVMAKGIKQVTYGVNNAFITGHCTGCSPFLTFQWQQRDSQYTVETQLIGAYNLDNALAAITVGRYFRIPSGRINRAIASYTPSNNRSQLKQTVRNHLIVDAYNANPDSMRAALRNFAAMDVSPKAVILGDMKELGSESLRLHQEIADEVRAHRFDQVFLCGEHFAQTTAGKDFTSYPDTQSLAAVLSRHPLDDFYILIKGSRSMALEQLIDLL